MKPNELLEIIKERRSYRQFQNQQIKKEELDMILEAGQYAPNAGGRQSTLFLVTQDKEINETLGRINRQAAIIVSGRYVNKVQPSIIDNPKLTSGFYGAPTIITLLAPKNFIYSEADCVAAGENMLLMASSLGLGGCMIARGKETMSSEYGQDLLRKVGIDDHYQGFYHIILGYPKGKTFVKERKDRVYYGEKI